MLVEVAKGVQESLADVERQLGSIDCKLNRCVKVERGRSRSKSGQRMLERKK